MGNKLDGLREVNYPPQIAQLLQKICDAVSKNALGNMSLKKQLNYKLKTEEKSVCAKIITKADAVVHCLNCQVDKSCIICMECFENGNHEGHKYQLAKGSSGCCDCGDRQAWKPEGFCKKHNGEVKQVEVDKQKLQKFVTTWEYLFFWYFRAELKEFGELIIECLKSITRNTEYAIMTAAALASRFDRQLHPKLKEDQYNRTILENILIYSVPMNRAPLTQLFISMFSNYQFKKLLIVGYFNVYQHILSTKETKKGDFSNLTWQLLTSHDLVVHALNTTNKVLGCPNKPIDEFGDPGAFSNLETYINDTSCLCKLTYGANLTYVRKFLSDVRNLENLAGYWQKVQNDWKDSYEDSEITDVFYIELMVIDVVFLIARVASEDKALLLKTIQDLCEYLKTKPVKNRCFFPLHRFLVIFLATYMNFSPFSSPEGFNSIEASLPLIASPFFKCLSFMIDKRAHPKIKELHYKYFQFYVDAFREAYSIDVFMVKTLVRIMGAKLANPLEFYMVNSNQDRAALFRAMIDGERGAPDQMIASVVRTVSCILGFLTELAVSSSEEISLDYHVTKDKTIYQKEIKQLLRAFFNCQTLATAEAIAIFKSKYLYEKMNIDSQIKQLCKYDKNLKKYVTNKTSEQAQTYLAEDFYITKGSVLSQSNKKPISQQTITPNKFMVPLLFPQTTLVQISQILDYCVSHPAPSEQVIAAFNMLITEFIKVFYLKAGDSKWFEEKLTHFATTKILDSRSQAIMTAITSAHRVEEEAPTNGEGKDKIKEIQRRKLDEIRKKQKKFNDKMNVTKIEVQQEEQTERCVFCHEPLKTSLSVYCCNLTNSNLYSLTQVSALSKNAALQPIAQKLRTYHEIRSSNAVLTSCLHPMHYDCFISFGESRSKAKLYCPLCRRKTNIIVPVIDGMELLNVKQTKDKLMAMVSFLAQMERLVTEDKDEIDNSKEGGHKADAYVVILRSFVEVFGYDAMLDHDHFLKRGMRLYQVIANSLKAYYQMGNTLNKIKADELKQALILNSENSIVQGGKLLPLIESYLDISYQMLIINTIRLYISGQTPAALELLSNYYTKFASDDPASQAVITQRVTLLWRVIHGSKESLTLLFSKIRQEKPLPYLLVNQQIQFTELPASYPPLSKLRGKCPNCNQGGNPIHLCLICPFRGCQGCTKYSLYKHATRGHASNGVFINLESTYVVYMAAQKAWIDSKLYINDIGEGLNIFNQWDQYALDEKEYHEIKTRVIRHQIPVFLQEKIRRQQRYYQAMQM